MFISSSSLVNPEANTYLKSSIVSPLFIIRIYFKKERVRLHQESNSSINLLAGKTPYCYLGFLKQAVTIDSLNLLAGKTPYCNLRYFILITGTTQYLNQLGVIAHSTLFTDWIRPLTYLQSKDKSTIYFSSGSGRLELTSKCYKYYSLFFIIFNF